MLRRLELQSQVDMRTRAREAGDLLAQRPVLSSQLRSGANAMDPVVRSPLHSRALAREAEDLLAMALDSHREQELSIQDMLNS